MAEQVGVEDAARQATLEVQYAPSRRRRRRRHTQEAQEAAGVSRKMTW